MISDPNDPNGPCKRVYTPNNSVFVRLAVRLTTVLESAAFVWRTAKVVSIVMLQRHNTMIEAMG